MPSWPFSSRYVNVTPWYVQLPWRPDIIFTLILMPDLQDLTKVSVYDPAFTDEDVKLLNDLQIPVLSENKVSRFCVLVSWHTTAQDGFLISWLDNLCVAAWTLYYRNTNHPLHAALR